MFECLVLDAFTPSSHCLPQNVAVLQEKNSFSHWFCKKSHKSDKSLIWELKHLALPSFCRRLPSQGHALPSLRESAQRLTQLETWKVSFLEFAKCKNNENNEDLQNAKCQFLLFWRFPKILKKCSLNISDTRFHLKIGIEFPFVQKCRL